MKLGKTNLVSIARFNLLLLVSTLSFTGYTQPPGGDGPPPFASKITSGEIAELQTEWMKKKLKLSKEQVEEVSKINLSFADKLQQLQKITENKNNGENRIHVEKVAVLDKEKDNALKPILSDKQFNIYLKKKAALNNVDSNSGNMPSPPPPPGGF